MTHRSPWSAACLMGLTLLLGATPISAQVDPKNPYEGPTVANIPPLPGATGPLPDAPFNKKSPYDVHEGVFTWGADLVTPGTICPDPWGTCPKQWIDSFAPQPPLAFPYSFTASPAFKPRLVDDALGAAETHLAGLDAGALGDAFDLFDLLPGIPVKEPTARKDWFMGYRPVRARWLKSQYVPTGEVFWMIEKKLTYPDFAPLQDVRLRGARLYCAARRAQFVQGGNARSLGSRAGFSVDVFGHTLEFLVVEPTVALNGPMKFMTPLDPGLQPDGAQAFIIPFAFGTRVTPIRGLGLPGLGEARVPVVLVTGDSEVRTQSRKRLIYEIGNSGLTAKSLFTKEHHTVTHADAIASTGYYSEQEYFLDKRFPFLIIGPLTVNALFELHFEVGTPSTRPGRVLEQAWWPNTPRSGHLYDNPDGFLAYHDGSWLLAKTREQAFFRWQVLPDGQTDTFWTDPIVKLSPTDLRALTDDDHTFVSTTALTLTLGLEANVGLTAGPFEVNAFVKGGFTGLVAQHHVLRDALMAEGSPQGFGGQMTPSTVVSVHPEQSAKVTFDGLEAGLTFDLELFVDSIHFERTFMNVPGTTLADYNSIDTWDASDERYMLRVGTGSSQGAPMTKPAVYSHLPGGSDFLSFIEDVPACLANPEPAPALKKPCPPTYDDGAPPHVNICVYGPSLSLVEKLGSATGLSLPDLPQNACTALGTWPGSIGGFDIPEEVAECFRDLVTLLCQPNSSQFPWQNREVVSHIWNFDGPFGYSLQAVMKQCVAAFQDPAVPVTPALADLLAEFVSVGPCDDFAHLYGDTNIVKAVNPSQAPTPKSGTTCNGQ